LQEDEQNMGTYLKTRGLTVFAIPAHNNALAFVNDPAPNVCDFKWVPVLTDLASPPPVAHV
jgi:hypothetical protein